jgi:hypothetical protein
MQGSRLGFSEPLSNLSLYYTWKKSECQRTFYEQTSGRSKKAVGLFRQKGLQPAVCAPRTLRGFFGKPFFVRTFFALRLAPENSGEIRYRRRKQPTNPAVGKTLYHNIGFSLQSQDFHV